MSRQLEIVHIVGARPQFIKLAMVVAELAKFPHVNQKIIHTGQHYDGVMSGEIFEQLSIPEPDWNLKVGSAPHAVQVARMLEGIYGVLIKSKPSILVLYGDTNSTLAGAIVGSKSGVPVAHVEAGMRSGRRQMQEEINRVLTDHCSDLLLCPSEVSAQNLRKEGLGNRDIVITGDVMLDAFLKMRTSLSQTRSSVAKIGLPAKGYILATIHRAENTDSPARLNDLLSALAICANQVPVILPLHPRTKDRMASYGFSSHKFSPIQFIDAVGYKEMLEFEMNAAVAVTDSGGVQKEAFFSEVPCVLLRRESEWPELIDLGWMQLGREDSVTALAEQVISMIGVSGSPGKPYGSGTAAASVCAAIVGWLEANT